MNTQEHLNKQKIVDRLKEGFGYKNVTHISENPREHCSSYALIIRPVKRSMVILKEQQTSTIELGEGKAMWKVMKGYGYFCKALELQDPEAAVTPTTHTAPVCVVSLTENQQRAHCLFRCLFNDSAFFGEAVLIGSLSNSNKTLGSRQKKKNVIFLLHNVAKYKTISIQAARILIQKR